MKKYFLSAAKLILLLSLALLVMLFIGSDILVCAPDSTNADSTLSGTDIAADSVTLGEGEQIALEFSLPEKGEAVWFSSNEETVTFADGYLTAHCSGEAIVTLTCGEYSDYVRVTVEKNGFADASALVETLASVGAPLEQLEAMQQRLERCTGTDAAAAGEVMNLLAECAAGSCDYDRICAAADRAGMNILTVLDAASYCWSAGESAKHDAVISFTGDCTIGMCNEKSSGYYFPSVYSAQESLTYPFDRVRRFFLNDDLTVINFEGVLTESSDNADKPFYFRGKPEYAAILPASGIEAATLANNHSMDYFREGYDDTVKHLGSAGVAAFDEGQPIEYTIERDEGDIRVAVFAFNLIGNTRPKPDRASLKLIEEYKTDPDTVVVVSVHWGSEYNKGATADQTSFGRALIDAGADVVVGHHPHILQGIELYKGKYIAYSLGNFSFSGNTEARYPQSAILQANVDYEDGRATVSGISIIPCYTTSSGSLNNNFQPCVQYGDTAEQIIQQILTRSGYTKYGAQELRWSGL